jgi:hypothetical protein
MDDIHEQLPLCHQSTTSICNGVSSRAAMSSAPSPRGHYNVHPISLHPSSPLKWLPGGFDIPTQTPQNVSSHIKYFFIFCSLSSLEGVFFSL